MKRQILVVEDNPINRSILNRILKNDYDILEACDGIEALDILKDRTKEISAVILDIVMPRMDGIEVLKRKNADPSISQIPVIVATGSDELGAEEKVLAAGANDYVVKPYHPGILLHRLRNTINLREQAAIVNAAKVDALTGLYSRSAFFEKVKEMVTTHESGYYCMGCFDIERFRVINDQYGTAKGDEVLKFIANTFRVEFSKMDGICCRIMADNFAVLYPVSFINSPELEGIRTKAAALDGSILPITFCIGRYLIQNVSMIPSAMYDRAAMAKESVKGRYDCHIALYDEYMRKKILDEQQIISEMNQALSEEQFEVWYQPQFNHATGALVGAEALVRWRHPVKGLISPGVFIPVFEKNGFIYEVDKYVWEQACIFLKEMKDTNRKVIPISVNISRYDVFRKDMIDVLAGLIEKYELPIHMLRLEITESAFEESSEQIINVIKQLKAIGFTMEIDDFGSGYSSLNTLKDVPADVLKLDMRFLEGKDNSEKGGSILEAIVRMSKWIDMSVIAEGVETKEQADFLKSIGCFYIQGYLYSKPLFKSAYEAMIEQCENEERMLKLEHVVNYDNEAFWNPSSIDTLIFNSFVGGACVFEYRDGKIDIIRVNEKYSMVLCGEQVIKTDAMSMIWSEHMTAGNFDKAKAVIESAIASGSEVEDEMEFLNLRGDGKTVYIRAIMRVMASSGDRYLFYCMIEDVTSNKLAAKQLADNAKELELLNRELNDLIDETPGGFAKMHINRNGKRSVKYINHGFCEMLGFTKDELMQHYQEDSLWGTHPSDLHSVEVMIACICRNQTSQHMQYRILNSHGEYISFVVHGRAVSDGENGYYVNAYYNEVT